MLRFATFLAVTAAFAAGIRDTGPFFAEEASGDPAVVAPLVAPGVQPGVGRCTSDGVCSFTDEAGSARPSPVVWYEP